MSIEERDELLRNIETVYDNFSNEDDQITKNLEIAYKVNLGEIFSDFKHKCRVKNIEAHNLEENLSTDHFIFPTRNKIFKILKVSESDLLSEETKLLNNYLEYA